MNCAEVNYLILYTGLSKLYFNNFSKKISKFHVDFSKIISGWISEDLSLDLLAFFYALLK